MSRGTCSSTEMLKGYIAGEGLGTPALYGTFVTYRLVLSHFTCSSNLQSEL